MVIDQTTVLGNWGKLKQKKKKFKCLFSMYKRIMEINKGRLAAIVYRSI